MPAISRIQSGQLQLSELQSEAASAPNLSYPSEGCNPPVDTFPASPKNKEGTWEVNRNNEILKAKRERDNPKVNWKADVYCCCL